MGKTQWKAQESLYRKKAMKKYIRDIKEIEVSYKHMHTYTYTSTQTYMHMRICIRLTEVKKKDLFFLLYICNNIQYIYI